MASQNRSNEASVIQQCLDGSSDAQRELYERFSSVLFAICLRYSKDEDQAQDMLQESYIKIFNNLGNFKFQGSFEGWLKRICVNQCLDYIRKDRSHLFTDVNDDALQFSIPEKSSDTLNEKYLMTLLRQLPLGYRTVFNMYAIEGYAHSEIASILGISENTSKTQLFKARKLLQKWLSDE